jgi:type II secretory pathway predicted ATPase ExeA
MHYHEYWGLKKAPFDNVPDPTMYVSSHTSAANAITETLFAIEEGNECLAVIVGDVGLGKTMALRMVIDSLNQDNYRIAFIVNPDMSFVQLLKEIVGQLTGKQCEIRRKMDLLETFNKILFETVDQGKKVVIFIDEANAMAPGDLEKMRLLTNLQPDDVNLFTIILAGQIEFAKRLAHPKRTNLFQRVGTYCTLEKIGSPEMVRSYIETRLSLAGGTRSIFTGDAIEQLWKHSEYGVPRLINKIAKLSLKAGETNGLEVIDGNVILQIADRFRRLNGPSPAQRLTAVPAERESQEETAVEHEPVAGTATVISFESRETQEQRANIGAAGLELTGSAGEAEALEQPAQAARADEEITISQYGVNVNIPADVIDESRCFSNEECTKMAGLLAAQTIQRHPRLTAVWGVDPLAVWSEIREVILTRLRQGQTAQMR